MTRPACISDLKGIAAVHQAAFPGFFLTQMGPRFLVSYYEIVLRYPGGVVFVEEEAEQIRGFVCGFLSPEAFYRFYSKNKLRLLLPILFGLFRRPWLLLKILRNVRRVQSSAREPLASDVAELSSVAVHPKLGGKGLGASLLRSFTEAVGAMGAKKVILTTDAENNDAVNRFYLRNEFDLIESFSQGNRSMNLYSKNL